MGAICDLCKKDMLIANGCKHDMIKFPDGVWMIRDTAGFARPGQRCHDCGAFHGEYHHPGCDNERCPRCHNQAIGCDCFGDDDVEVDYGYSPYKTLQFRQAHAALLTMRDHFGKPWIENTANVVSIRDYMTDNVPLPKYMQDCGDLIKKVWEGNFPL